MLVAHVHLRVLLERMGGFPAAALASARASLTGPGVSRFAAVFPAGDEGWKSGLR